MNRYHALVQERADLVRAANAILDRAEREQRTSLTDDERREFDGLQARIEGLNADIAREERRREWERQLATVPDGNVAAAARERGRQADDRQWGFTSLVDFARSVRDACRPGGRLDERLALPRAAVLDERRQIAEFEAGRSGIMAAPTNVHQEAGSDDGYMVPPEYRAGIWTLVDEGNFDDGADLFGLTNPEPTMSNAVSFLRDASTPWAATGIQAVWRSENVQMTPSRLDTDGTLNRLFELYAFVTATEEILQDAPLMNSRLTRGAAAAIRFKQNQGVMWGTGAGRPLGWMSENYAGKVQVSKEAGQAAATVVAANVAKMYARVINPGSAIWIAHQATLPQLFTMTLGQNSVFVPPSTGFQNAPGGFLLGRPVVLSQHNKTVGTAGDLQIVNPRGYYSVRRSDGPQFAESIHLFFDYNVRAFRWVFRLGGMPYLAAAVSPNEGADTLSHFVYLETRS